MGAGLIHELRGLEDLEGLADEYQKTYGAPPFNVSHWDPSDLTIRKLLKYLKLPDPPAAMPYIYSYFTGAAKDVAERLGFSWKNRDCLLVHSGTSAIVLLMWWLKARGFKHLIILCPTYFPALYLAHVMTLPYQTLFARREQGEWRLPMEEITNSITAATETAVWVTNPIYCTGVYLSAADRSFLGSLLDVGVTIVADECLSKSGREVSRDLGSKKRFVGLYTPHKAVCLNAVKFGALVFDREDEEFFDSWADIFAGGLSASNHIGIFHFLERANFSKFDLEFSKIVDEARDRVNTMIRPYTGTFEIDENSIGHFMTCYVPELPGHQGDDNRFLRSLVFETGAIVISGMRNHFDPSWGFCFRINLARACPQFYASLNRTLRYLADRVN